MIYKFSEKRGVAYYVNRFIDERCAARLERKSKEYYAARQGRKMAIFANEHIGISINQYGCYDKFCLDLLFDFLRPLRSELQAGVILDIGANIGNHAVYFSSHAAHVYSFEPNPRTFDLLSFNAKMAGNVTPFNVGLGEREETLELNENPENMGASSIRYGAGADRPKVPIAVKRLDDIALDLPSINLVKIDVEGFEPYVLRGGQRTLEKHQPVVLLEQHAPEFVNGTTDSIELLKEMGYRFCWHQPANAGAGLLSRRLNTLATMFLGRTYDYAIVSADKVPVKSYLMLIAVPRRFQQVLGLAP